MAKRLSVLTGGAAVEPGFGRKAQQVDDNDPRKCAKKGCNSIGRRRGVCSLHYSEGIRSGEIVARPRGLGSMTGSKAGDENTHFFAACMMVGRDHKEVLSEFMRDFTRKVLSKTASKYL